MKISHTGTVGPVGRNRKAGQSGRAGGNDAFRAHMENGDVSDAKAPPGAAPLAALGSLLAIQEVPDPTSGKRRAVLRGDTILDELKELQIGLVQGWVTEDTLRTLARMLDRPRLATDDPELEKVLDDIELRASVELAKFEREPSR